MLETMDVAANIAVKDLDKARRFYADTLGLKQIDKDSDQVIVFQSGLSKILVYKSEFAGTNKATAATWTVGDDVQGIARSLKPRASPSNITTCRTSRGKGDIHVCGNMKMAWFKDPDGNILCVVNGKNAKSR
jgi:catechol 2,3-dioxygenase-like lactoylglutathione lyase family enzyme